MARISDADRSTWEQRGGRIRFDAKGRSVYVIRKQIAGHRYEVSTHRHTLAAALAEWERFERDPEGYSAGDAAPLYLDADPDEEGVPRLIKDFLRWSLVEKGNTAAWVTKQKDALAWWMPRLRGVNLRRARLQHHIAPALEKAADKATRARVLKAFYGWLRKERHLLTYAEDPTLDLRTPSSKPAQRVKSKVIPREHYLLIRDHFRAEEQERAAKRGERRSAKVVSIAGAAEEPRDGPWADALTLQAGTGWHTTEVVRFATSGTIEPLPPAMTVQHGAVGVLVCPLHKSGDTHRTAVSAEVLEAAKRLRQHGAFSREWYDRAVRTACAKVKRPDGETGIPLFTPGRFRHSVATWAIEAGADPFAVSAFLGHKSPSTTKKFYATLATVPTVPTLA